MKQFILLGKCDPITAKIARNVCSMICNPDLQAMSRRKHKVEKIKIGDNGRK